MTASGQTEKNSVRAKVFRIASESGPCTIQLVLRFCASSGHRQLIMRACLGSFEVEILRFSARGQEPS